MWRMKKVIHLDKNAYKYFKTETPKFTLDMELDLKGKCVVITGASSGIGLAFTEILYSRNATVVMIVRNVKKAKECTENIKKQNPTSQGKLFIFQADLSSYDSVIRVVFQILKGCKKIDLLVNNAGIGAPKERTVTVKEGTELVMASNYFGHFLLTINLLPLLRLSKGKVISITSFAFDMYDLDEDFCQREKKYNGWRAYSNSKACQIIMTKKLSQIIHFSECSFIAVSPGIVNTPISEAFSNNLMGKTFNFLLTPIKNFICRKLLLSPEKACEQIISLAFFASKKIFHGAYVSQNRIIHTNFTKNLENKIWMETFHELLMNTKIEARRLLRGPMTNEESLVFIKRHPEIYLAYLELDDLNLWEKSVILPNEIDLFEWLNETTALLYKEPTEYSEQSNDYVHEDSIFNSLESVWETDSKNSEEALETLLHSNSKELENYIKDYETLKNKNLTNERVESTSGAVIRETGNHDMLSKNINKTSGLMDSEMETNIQQSNIRQKSNVGTINFEFKVKNDITTDDVRENKCNSFHFNGSDYNDSKIILNKNKKEKKSFKKKGSFIKRLIRSKKELEKKTDLYVDNTGCDVVKSADDYISDIIPIYDEQMSWSQSFDENKDIFNSNDDLNYDFIKYETQQLSKNEHINEEVKSSYNNTENNSDNNEFIQKIEDRSSVYNNNKHSSTLDMVSNANKNLINDIKSTNFKERKDCEISGSFQHSSNKLHNLNITPDNKRKIKIYDKPYIEGKYTQDNFDKFFIINYKNKMFDFIESAIETITVEDVADFVNMEKILRKNGFKHNFSSLTTTKWNSETKSGNISSMVFKNYYPLEGIENNSNKDSEEKNVSDPVKESNFIRKLERTSSSSSEPELIVFLDSDDEEGFNLGSCESIPPIGAEYDYEYSDCGSLYVTKSKLEDDIYKVKYDMKLLVAYKVISKVSQGKHFDSDGCTNSNNNDDNCYQHKMIKLQDERNEITAFSNDTSKALIIDDYNNENGSNDKSECLSDRGDESKKMIKKENMKNENKNEDVGIKNHNITRALKDNGKKRKKRISFKDNILKKSNFIAALYKFDKKDDEIEEHVFRRCKSQYDYQLDKNGKIKKKRYF